MIKGVLVAVLLVLSPFAQAERVFEGERVVEIFQSQDFDANLIKAKEGDVRAQYLVGAAYLYGLEAQEVEVDHEQGRYWLEKAADQGAAEAYSELARIYRSGMGVEKDASKYEEYLAEAGERGMRSRKLELLDLYRDGDPELNIEPDEDKYIYWLQVTAEDGLTISMENLAVRYRQGRGVERDLEKAFEWIIRAVEQDDSLAQAYAGEFFEEGLGTEQDFVKAYMMYDLSTGIGREAKYELADKMTEEQIEEAIARSWQWQMKHGVVRPSSDGYRYQPDVSDLEPLSLTPESDQ
ncbi:tetratricopeptide repeat protein [Halomonas mongoliensis]|uniref:Tetratricopeptide repeat protein n=1 Tax=Halomonas mongoliensis TaxID=321265 RepID=A0ABU1GPN6_9GAMM|nr:tetratricopeptide repeat protein [Halomonas mongoliensis]MDR5893990.1 tetratricopeptide repeat protein [Halomonas mongoliensis]